MRQSPISNTFTADDGSTARVANSTTKTMHVLEGLLLSDGSAQLADIARRCSLPKPTVHRILQTLVADAYVQADGEGRYAAGPRLLVLAGRVLQRRDYQSVGQPILRTLQSRTGHTVHFAILAGHEAVYVDKVEPREAYQMASRVGMRIPLHCTAIGKAVLAASPRDYLEDHLRSVSLTKRTDRTLVTKAALRDEMARIREVGYAIDEEENEANVRCVGAAVVDHLGHAIGGISVSSLTFRLPPEEAHSLGPVVRAAAQEISTAMGHTDAVGDAP